MDWGLFQKAGSSLTWLSKLTVSNKPAFYFWFQQEQYFN